MKLCLANSYMWTHNFGVGAVIDKRCGSQIAEESCKSVTGFVLAKNKYAESFMRQLMILIRDFNMNHPK